MNDVQILEQKLLHLTGKAIGDFGLIQNNDSLLLGLSGGKDSWTLLHLLTLLQQRAPIKFTMTAVTIDPGFPEFSVEPMVEYLDAHKYNYKIKRTHIKQIIKDKLKPNTSFCSFCARLRRGALYSSAHELGCHKVVLAHHREDTIETLLLNQFYSGRLKAMPPKLISDDKKNIVIRPLIYIAEEDIAEYARMKKFPIVVWQCPMNTEIDGKRKRIKRLLAELEQESPGLKSTILHALQSVAPSHFLDTTLYPTLKGDGSYEEINEHAAHCSR